MTTQETVYPFEVKTIDGKTETLEKYKGKVLLIVNVASRCGFTPQYESLEKLYRQHKDRGFEVLGFPCNQFGEQEPGSDEEIKGFCETKFQVTFPLFSKVDVKGENSHPLFAFLTKVKRGLLGTSAIKWNFTKFLIDRKGHPVKRYGSIETPEKFDKDIQKLL